MNAVALSHNITIKLHRLKFFPYKKTVSSIISNVCSMKLS